VTNDDLVYVADRSNNRLQIFRLDGTFIKEVFIARNTLQNEGTVYAFAVSPDKDQKFSLRCGWFQQSDSSPESADIGNRHLGGAGTPAIMRGSSSTSTAPLPIRKETSSWAKSTTGSVTTGMHSKV